MLHLLNTKRFLPLFITQFLGAFNDNLFKNALVMLIIYEIAVRNQMNGQLLVTIAAGIFILPFFLFSATAGQFADRYEKSILIQRIKLFEIILAILASIALYQQNTYFLLGILFLLGAQSAFFGPLKYSILPDHLRTDELIGGNGLIEMGTFTSILLGTITGGLLIRTDIGLGLVSSLLIVCAISGWLASRFIPISMPAASTDISQRYWNIVDNTWRMLRHAAARRDIFLAMLGISWFWLLGATYLAQLPNYGKNIIGANEQVVTLFLTAFTLGIGVGSVLCHRLVKGEITAKYVPLGALGMTVFAVDLYFASQQIQPNANATLIGAYEFLQHWNHWRILADFSLLAICGGIYIVPLYSIIQNRSAVAHRSRNIASLNILNALFMVVSAAASAVLLASGLAVPDIFLILAIFNTLVAIYICRLLPQALVKWLLRKLFRLLYQVEIDGMQHYQQLGDKAVIVINHTSLLDGPLLGAFLPDEPSAVMNSYVAQRWWAKPALALFNIITVDPTNPLSVRKMVRLVKDKNKLIIFPEGRITVTGALMKIYEGPGTVAYLADAPILPVRIDGAQFTPFSRLRGKLPIRWLPKIHITILPPQHFQVPDTMRGRERRHWISAQLYTLMSDMMFTTSDVNCTLFDGLLRARKLHDPKTPILEDVQRQPLNYQQLITGSLVLARRFAKLTEPHEAVGMLLPNSNAAVLGFFALQACNRVPAMLNFSSGLQNLRIACETGLITTIITSRRFVSLAKLEASIEALSRFRRIVYLEDLRASLGVSDKLFGLLARLMPKTVYRQLAKQAAPDMAAVILFTSGSEGVPKGVVLSHKNIQANRYQLSARIDFTPSDIVFNALPVFHSFGLNSGLLLPLLSGIKVFLYPSPLHYRIVPQLVYDTNATIMFGTDTFLLGYARRAHPYDFYSIRYIFAGAEKVNDATRLLYADKFGIRILEGYGATETAPVLAANTPMQYKAGTVGCLLPGIDYRLQDVPGLEQGQRLEVKGPNIMLGYMKYEDPGRLQPPTDGWYDTGDIVEIDAEGYIRIVGRAKRFAKIAGEMVSLTAVEAHIAALWPKHQHAIIAIPDARKGEQLVLVTDYPDADRKAVSEYAQAQGIAELMVPRQVLVIDKLPVLGTGKTDYLSLSNTVKQRLQSQ